MLPFSSMHCSHSVYNVHVLRAMRMCSLQP